jgi:hypothetical protein
MFRKNVPNINTIFRILYGTKFFLNLTKRYQNEVLIKCLSVGHFPSFGQSVNSGVVLICRQGNQVGRIFAYWVIVFFGQFFEN